MDKMRVDRSSSTLINSHYLSALHDSFSGIWPSPSYPQLYYHRRWSSYMIIIYHRHIFSSYMSIIYDHDIWWSCMMISIWWSCMMIMYDDHIWWSCMMTVWSFMMIIYDDHIWWSYIIITYDDHIGWCFGWNCWRTFGNLICFHNCLVTFGICFGIMTGTWKII
jgi:hypothetical protein